MIAPVIETEIALPVGVQRSWVEKGIRLRRDRRHARPKAINGKPKPVRRPLQRQVIANLHLAKADGSVYDFHK